MRTLATIQTIQSLASIPGYDLIESASVLGWNLVVKKGEFAVGALCVFCEPDSVMPDRPEFEFLNKYKRRIKTRRLGKVISQGIAFPLSILDDTDFIGWVTDPEDAGDGSQALVLATGEGTSRRVELTPGTDVTELLGVTKYEPPEFEAGSKSQTAGAFPSHLISRTDEPRIQSLPHILPDLVGVPLYTMEKVDGSSMTVVLEPDPVPLNTEAPPTTYTFSVNSRNQKKRDVEGCFFWDVAHALELEKKLRWVCESHAEFAGGVILQGELVGPGIQDNRLKLKERTFMVFNVYNLGTRTYLGFPDWVKFCEVFKIPTVPIHTECFVPDATTTVQTFVDAASRNSLHNPEVLCEGIVIRPRGERQHPLLGRLSFKAINPHFLLKHDL